MSSRNGHPTLAGTKAVVLAGGRGTRLAPYTSVLPKPLMPVADKAILEIVVDQLESHGISDISFCVGYLSHLIRAVFDYRANGHVRITYVQEQEALGTAAPLHLVPGLDETFLVMNGDVLSTLDYGELVRHHRESENVLTIATFERSIKIDYGILHLDVSSRVREFEEKPEIISPVSMGIYAMEPDVLDYIPTDRHFDFPDLVKALLRDGGRVGSYRHDGLWFDIGRHEDYEQAVAAWAENGDGERDGQMLDPRVRADGNGKRRNGWHITASPLSNGNGRVDGQAPTTDRKEQSGLGVGLESFAETFSRVPSPVSVVTTFSAEGRPHGTTVSAFCSLSADPPLVLVALDRASELLGLLRKSGRFGINLLGAGQDEIGRICARKGPDKFDGLSWHEDGGLPRVDGAAAWLACEVEDVLPGGDHLIVVGLVTACETDEGDPLVYHLRAFRKLGDAATAAHSPDALPTSEAS
jgi:flavin reductase (DIM6/NTAB) family NADH-FMN oxidoreductase RutF/dTDP-glucose pyrophosphorylase